MLIVDGESTWNTVKVFRAESIDHIGEGIFKILLGVSLDLTGDLRKNIGHVVKPDRKKLAESKSPALRKAPGLRTPDGGAVSPSRGLISVSEEAQQRKRVERDLISRVSFIGIDRAIARAVLIAHRRLVK